MSKYGLIGVPSASVLLVPSYSTARGPPSKYLVCARQQRILKHDIGAPAGAAEGAQLCLGDAGCIGSKGRRWGGSTVVPGGSSRGIAVSEVSTTGSFSDSSSSNMRGFVCLVTPDEGCIIRSFLVYQKRRCGECTSASSVVPLGIKPRFESSKRFSRGMPYLWPIRSHVQAVPHCP